MNRLHSLDAFRGATIAAMILVNNPGDWKTVYGQLLHAAWHGWTFTDVIFPFFLWIMGVAMTLSLGRWRERPLLHAARRAAILFALGLFLNLFPYFDFANIRIPGVLQRIAVCYLAAAVIFLFTSWKGQAAWTAGMLGVYWALMTLVPVPGHGPGVLEKGTNLSHYLDNLVLQGHMWQQTKTWDPEGILSTLPAIATVLFGVLAGQLVRRKLPVSWLFAGGSALIVGAHVMSIWMPFNKNLWTSSYAVLMAGLASVVFALFYWVIDVQGRREWARPFVIYGMNAIAIYVFAGMLGDTLSLGNAQRTLYRSVFAPLAAPKMASLLYAVCFVAVTFAVAWVMYRKKWFVRI